MCVCVCVCLHVAGRYYATCGSLTRLACPLLLLLFDLSHWQFRECPAPPTVEQRLLSRFRLSWFIGRYRLTVGLTRALDGMRLF